MARGNDNTSQPLDVVDVQLYAIGAGWRDVAQAPGAVKNNTA
jgi:hypothetical protein